jgi:KGK domain
MHLDRFDVVSLMVSSKKVTAGTTFMVGEFANTIGELIKQKTSAPHEEWARDGIECLVLQPGSGWAKGRVRISLEFIPEVEEEEEETNSSIAVIEPSPTSTDVVFGGNSSEIQ